MPLDGGDEQKGLVQQNLEAGGIEPVVMAAPDLQTNAGEVFAVPAEITIPPGI